MSLSSDAVANFKQRAWQVLFFALALLLWQALVQWNKETLIPSPAQVFTASIELAQKGVLLQDLSDSLRRVLIGFSAGALAGIVLGFALGAVSLLRIIVLPFLEFLRPIPPIAWIPLAISIFGLGDQSACFVIFIGSFYPILTNTMLGVQEVPLLYLDAAKSLGCDSWRALRYVVWPCALPSLFAGIKVGLGFGWMCVVAAEMIAASSGLGYEIQLNRQLLRLDRVFVGMLLIGLVGFLMNMLVVRLERKLIPWRPQKNRAVSEPMLFERRKDDTLLKDTKGAGITVRELCFSYGNGQPALDTLSFELASGQVLCLLGPSGCGKTTLLRLIAHLLKPASGSVLLDGMPLDAQYQDATMVFQNSALFPWRTALQNVRFPIEMRGDEEAQAMRFLDIVGLTEKANSYPHELSGGQQQRVALARALAYKPRVLLLDEPFAALDSQTRETLQEDLRHILNATGITALFVTHDVREAVFVADQVMVLSRKGGRILHSEEIEDLPRDEAFRYSPAFAKARVALWNCLKDESAKAGLPG